PRKVYSMNEVGEAYFHKLLREKLASAANPRDPYDAGLMFLDYLSEEEAAACLQTRLAFVEEQIDKRQRVPEHNHAKGVQLTIERNLTLLRADRDWLKSVIDSLK
ncbi:MAG TPA: PadR family transcriptional regulator, partial [Bacillales bacterium]|nr:PadR family transcriptional regulator [Bacillales bacterium]